MRFVRLCVWYLVLVLAEGLQDVSLTGVVSVGVLQALQQTFFQDQNWDSQLVPQQLHRPKPQEVQRLPIAHVHRYVFLMKPDDYERSCF